MAVGLSPADRRVASARHIGWEGAVLSSSGRVTSQRRPGSPDGRPDPAEVFAAADAAVEAQR